MQKETRTYVPAPLPFATDKIIASKSDNVKNLLLIYLLTYIYFKLTFFSFYANL